MGLSIASSINQSGKHHMAWVVRLANIKYTSISWALFASEARENT
jgi:hypothetical protein